MHFSSTLIIPLICAVAIIWILVSYLRRKKSRPVTGQSKPRTPTDTQFDPDELISLERMFQNAWDNLKRVDNAIILPIIVDGEFFTPRITDLPYRAMMGETPAIVDPTFTGPVIFYIKDGLVWMYNEVANEPVVNMRDLVYNRLYEISKQST